MEELKMTNNDAKFKSRKFILTIIVTVIFVAYSVLFFLLMLDNTVSGDKVNAITTIMYVISGLWLLVIGGYFKFNKDSKKLFYSYMAKVDTLNNDEKEGKDG